MAFVRWRGNSASLLATVYDEGRTRQVLLAPLGCGYRVPTGVRELVAERFPNIFVDWESVNQTMEKGPSGAAPLTTKQLSYLEAEQSLRVWGELPNTLPGERQQLLAAATVLSEWRSQG